MPTATRVSEVLRVDRLETGDRKLVRDLVIDLGIDLGIEEGTHPCFSKPEDTTIVTVPAEFETDFSSIPPWARILYRFDSVDLAGCCHDLAYQVGVKQSISDEIWRIVAMSGQQRVGRFRARLGWLGLRLGGGCAYKPTGDVCESRWV